MLQIRGIYNHSIHQHKDLSHIITDSFKDAIVCDGEEMLYICINKMILPRHITNYNNENSYIPVHVMQSYPRIKVNKDTEDPLDKYGSVVYEYATYSDYEHEVQYFPLIGKELKKVDFFLDLSNVHAVYNSINLDKALAINCSISIQYTIVKVSLNSVMERLIHKSLIVDNKTNAISYPDNKANNFRCLLSEALDTSHDSGHPYVQVNSVTIPASINFHACLRDAMIYVVASFTGEKVEDRTYRYRFAADYEEHVTVIPIFSEAPGEALSAKMFVKIPLFFSEEKDDITIQGSFNLVRQIKKRLDPLQIDFSYDRDNNKIRIRNKSEADQISIIFNPPSLAAAIGHVHKLSEYDYEYLENLDPDDHPWPSNLGIYVEPEEQEEVDQGGAATTTEDADADDDVESVASNEVEGANAQDEQDEEMGGLNIAYIRQVDFSVENISALDFDIFRMAPSTLYIYTNFADETFVHGSQKRLLAVIDTSDAYDKNRRRDLEHLMIPIHNKKPMIAHINNDTVQHMHFTLETSEGEPFPFLTNDLNDQCKLSLSFRFK